VQVRSRDPEVEFEQLGHDSPVPSASVKSNVCATTGQVILRPQPQPQPQALFY
jgi:hypothetical protein